MGRKQSEERFLQGLEELLIQGEELGVNALAEKAGLNKVLLYRYFGGWEGLLEVYARRINLWRSIREALEHELQAGSLRNTKEAVLWVFRTYRKLLLGSPVYLRILKEELWRPNPLSKRLEQEREEEGLALSRALERHFPGNFGFDTEAFGALVGGGLTYLILKSTQVAVFNGLELSQEAAWERIDALVAAITAGAPPGVPPRS